MEIKENNCKRVSGTLDYGMRLTLAFTRFMWTLIVLGVVCFIVGVIAIFTENEPLFILFATLPTLVFWCFGGYYIIRERRHADVIKLWCEDAVELDAFTEKVCCEAARKRSYGKSLILLNPKYNQPYILKVKIKYKNIKHTYFSLSRDKSPFDSFFLRYWTYHGKMVAEYGGGKVKILYSPKYDKVMFLIDAKPKIDDTKEIE